MCGHYYFEWRILSLLEEYGNVISNINMFLLITHSVYVPYILSQQNLAKEQTNNTTSSIEPASTLFVYLFFCLSRVHGHNGIYVWYSRCSITLWFCITHKYIKCKIMSLEVRLQFGSFSIVCCLCSLFCVCCVRCRPMVPHRSRTGMDNNGAYVSARARERARVMVAK